MIKQTFKIAKIIDESTFIINGGFTDGVKKKDVFNIKEKGDSEVLDPDTLESLGTIDFIKGTIIAETVLEKMTICKTETKTTYINNITGAVESIKLLAAGFEELSGNRSYSEQIKLKVDEKQITPTTLNLEDDTIKIGDIVEKATLF